MAAMEVATHGMEDHEKFDYEEDYEEEEEEEDYEDMSDDENMAASYNILSEANESLKRVNENLERLLAAAKLKEQIASQVEMIARIKKEIAVVVEQTACSKKQTAWCMEQIAKYNQNIASRDKQIAEVREQLKRKIIRATFESSVLCGDAGVQGEKGYAGTFTCHD